MLVEQFLIIFTVLYATTLFVFHEIDGYPFRFCVGILQYFKFYLVPSTMGSVIMQRSQQV